jgi:hypothetical protein
VQPLIQLKARSDDENKDGFAIVNRNSLHLVLLQLFHLLALVTTIVLEMFVIMVHNIV